MSETKILRYTKKDDLLGEVEGSLKMDYCRFIRTWKNTKSTSGLIVKVSFEEVDGELYMHAFGSDEPNLQDWGKTKCQVFTDKVNDTEAGAFKAKYSFDFMDVEIAANVKLGVLVLQTYSTFKDGSNRSNYYNREFYGPV